MTDSTTRIMSKHYHWYPVYTRSRAEKKAYNELVRKKITAYLPLKTAIKQWSDRKIKVEEPLIRSYVFVYISAKEYREVLMTRGITRFVYFSNQIATVPAKQMEDLRLLLAKESDLEVFNYNIRPGQKVLIYAGPFKGIVAELVSLNNSKNIVLRLQNMGYAINIKTSMAFIKPFKTPSIDL